MSEHQQLQESKHLSSRADLSRQRASTQMGKGGLLVNRSPLLLTCLTARLLCFLIDPHGLSLLLSPGPSGHSFLFKCKIRLELQSFFSVL